MRFGTLARTGLILFAGVLVYIAGTFGQSAGAAGIPQDKSSPQVIQKGKIGGVPRLAKSENLVQLMEPVEQIRMLLSFEPRHQDQLEKLIADLYNPASPSYHQWIAPQEFGERFGRTPEEFTAAVNWLQSQGLQVDRQYPSRLGIGFTGSVDTVQQAFSVVMARYWDSNNQRAFYSNMEPPTLPGEIQSIASGLEGLNDAVLYKTPSSRKKPVPATQAPAQEQVQDKSGQFQPAGKVGSATILLPHDLAVLYDYLPLWNNNIKGSGQKVGVVIDSDMNDSDMSTYRTNGGLPAANLQRKLYPGFVNPGITGDAIETTLDAESISAVAPSAEIDLVLIPSLSSISIYTAESDIISENVIKQVNESFGICESEGYSSSEATLFNQAVTQGIAFFGSAGDEGADCDQQNLGLKGVECPACYQGVTGVGGTRVTATYDSQSNVTGRSSEVVWNTTPGVRTNCSGGSTGGGAGGGGICGTVSLPTYQQSAQGFTGGVPSGTKRFVPDVAAIADPSPIGAMLVFNGLLYYGGGTSQSSPLWAGMMALINNFKGSPQGSPNTVLYQLGVNQYKNAGPHAFVDITIGNNSVAPISPCLPGGQTGYSAGTGFDPVTGWGVPDLNVISQGFGGSQSQYSGFLDGAGCNVIEGWAWDSTNPNTAISIDIYDGNTLVTTATAGMYREDLLNVLGSPNHGYSVPTPASLKDGASHSVSVKIHGTSTTLSGGPRTVHCSGSSNLQGALDGVGCDAISGWAWDGNHPGDVVNVDIYDGSTLVATVAATLYRQDLQNTFGSAYHGFTYPAPSSFKDGQTHTITAKFGGSSTTLTWNNPQSFSCTGAAPNYQGSQDVANCTSITGYAWDTNNDRCTIDVAIYLDGAFQVVVPAQQALPGIGNGYHGFSFAVPPSWKDGKQHSIMVKISGTNTVLANSPRTLTCP